VWLTYGRDYFETHFSPLKLINEALRYQIRNHNPRSLPTPIAAELSRVPSQKVINAFGARFNNARVIAAFGKIVFNFLEGTVAAGSEP
jgi:hypothetical protein